MFAARKTALILFLLGSGQTAGAMQAGVNLSALEISPGTLPGVYGTNYTTPSYAELAYYAGKGVTLIRLPIEWERIEPNLLANPSSAVLDDAYLSLIKGVLQNAAGLGMGVIIDIHNYGQYDQNWFGNGVITQRMFNGLWLRIAHRLGGLPGLAGYDLMNEPEGFQSGQVWPRYAQGAVLAIRKLDQRTPIYVEGDNWASATTWQQVNGALSIKDPAGAIIYEAHAYGDWDSSGTHFSWAQNVANGVTVNTLAGRIANFTGWCQAKAVRCMIGETGVGNDAPEWNTELANGLALAASAGVQSFTYWAGGPWWGSYPMSIEPDWNTNPVTDAPQMAVVSLYGVPPADRVALAK